MNYTFDKKSKKSLKSSRRHISLGIPTNIAVGSLGFRAELDIGSKGERSRPYRDLGADRPDSTMTVDENDPRSSRIVFCDKESEDQGPLAPIISTHGVVVDASKHGNDPASGCFRFLLSRQVFMQRSIPLPIRRDNR